MAAIKMKSEHMEQVELVSWFRKNYHPEHRLFAIPNGGLRSKSTALALRSEGVSAGIPDLMFPSLFAYIEMKRQKRGVVSPEQKEWLEYLASVGYKVRVCNGKEEAQAFIIELMNEKELNK